MNVHFIAIGGSAMHNLAMALKKKKYNVTGSDDEIFEPALSRLKQFGLLPNRIGWYEDNINDNIDAVILGMHARADNPELLKAQKLGIKIYSYPEYIYEQSKNKLRVVIGGSHGKTTITAMILHVLNYYKRKFDYMVGAQLDGFEVMVKLDDNIDLIILEGDEYLTSPIDRRPKFHLYKPNIALISGIAWDHINVFPTFDNYVEQFSTFINLIEDKGSLIYCNDDENLKQISEQNTNNITKTPYSLPDYEIVDGKTYIIHDNVKYPVEVFGQHNLSNINGARLVCNQLGIESNNFYEAIGSFGGASKRLELVSKTEYSNFYKDFAHSPSKLKATITAVKEQFTKRKLVACIELHTFSSLNKTFLKEYKNSMDNADIPIVYFNPHTIEHKKLEAITPQDINNTFENLNIKVFTSSDELLNMLLKYNWIDTNLLMMSSGNFDGFDFIDIAKKIYNAEK